MFHDPADAAEVQVKVNVAQSFSMSAISVISLQNVTTQNSGLPSIMCCPELDPHTRGSDAAPEWTENWAVRHWVRGVARESWDTRELGPDTENVSKLSLNWQMSGELRHS